MDDSGYFFAFVVAILVVFVIFLAIRRRSVIIGEKEIGLAVVVLLIYMYSSTVLFMISVPFSLILKSVLVTLLTYSLVKSCEYAKRGSSFKDLNFEIRVDFLLVLFGVLLLSYFNMFFGYGFVGDWAAHRLKLVTLFDNPIEPRMNLSSGESGNRLTYYYGLFLPSAYVTRPITQMIQVDSTEDLAYILSIVFYLWLFFGVFLAAVLLPIACQRLFDKKGGVHWGIGYIVLILFSGFNYWHRLFYVRRFFVGHSEWSVDYFAQITSMISLWQWAPFHLVSGLVGVVLLGIYWEDIKGFPFAVWSAFLITSSFFVFVGILPFMLVYLDRFRKELLGFMRELGSAVLLSLMVIIFYLSKIYVERFRVNRSLMLENGLTNYFFFLFIEFMPVILVLVICLRDKIAVPPIIVYSIILLLILPVFELGRGCNDLVMRGCIPAFFILVLFSAYVVEKIIRDGSLLSRILCALLIFSFLAAFINEFYLGLTQYSPLFVDESAYYLYLGSDDVWGVVLDKLYSVFA